MLYLCILLLETRVKVGGAKSDECPFFQNVGKGPKTSFVSNKTYVACAMFHCLTTKWIHAVVVEPLFPKQSAHSNDIQAQFKFLMLPFKQATSSG